MNDSIFRSVEFWKSALLTMPDNSFFELLRNVFGKIKTPFNKQQLLKDLEIFLLREDIQKTIAAYIDENDSKIIAAVSLFGEAAPGDLEDFFSGEFSSGQLQDIIVNLEERFILYRFSEENASRIALNPVLEKALSPVAGNISVLLKSPLFATAGCENASPALNDRILAALLSFVLKWESFFRAEGVIRKQVIEAGKTCFPGFELERVIGCLQILGLFYADADRLLPDKKRFDDFCQISERERMEYCAAALLAYDEVKIQTEILPPLFRTRIRDSVNFIRGFLGSLDVKFLYTEKILNRLKNIHTAKTGIKQGDKFLDALEKTGLITGKPDGERLFQLYSDTAAVKSESPVIAVDSGFSILVYPEINFIDAIAIAGFLNIREAGAVVCFELDKNSAVRAFDKGINADEITKILLRLSGGRADDALLWNLKDWEKRHREVSLKKGIVLSLSQDKLYLSETQPLAAMISETLAPGVFLLGENMMEEASAALHNAGIDIIACHVNKKNQTGALSLNTCFPPPSAVSSILEISETGKENESIRDNLISEFQEFLSRLPLGKPEKDELSARIDRRLVLCKDQLREADIRYEKLEARHMDYTGKQIIAKQAIAQRSPVEIIRQGKEKKIFGVPDALVKENGDLILVIDCGDDVTRIPLAKISLLRRIKKSIFEK
ncbi:MAG: hypothetical protein FWC19_03980 [Treponema sp.]|nr:hypothetical protein [Treponema sp.]